MTEAELFKQMEQGKLLSAEVLPKVAKEYKRAALNGGAYEKALKGLVVTEGRFLTQSQKAGDIIFKSGFSAGLTELYDTLAKTFKDAGPQLEKIGRIFGAVFRGMAHALKVLEPFMKFYIDNFEIMFGAGAILMLRKFSAVAKSSLATAFLPITLALAAAEELASLMSDKLVGTLEKTAGRQYNILEGTVTGLRKDEQGRFISGGKGIVGKGASFGKTMDETHALLRPAMAAMKGIGMSTEFLFGNDTPAKANVVNNNTFTVSGVAQYKEIESQLVNDASASPSL